MSDSAAPDVPPGRRGRLPLNLAPPRKLSDELVGLQERSRTEILTLRDVIQTLGGRSYSLLLILLALPFITPIPLPGLSTPFGVAIALIALRLTLGQRPFLPKGLQRREIPAGFFDKLVKVAAGVIRFLEKFLRPRLAVVTEFDWVRQIHALLMVLAALTLLLPLPIPFTNSFPAWVVILMAGGLLARDGVVVILAYAVFAAGIAYFVFLGEAAVQLIEVLRQWLLN